MSFSIIRTTGVNHTWIWLLLWWNLSAYTVVLIALGFSAQCDRRQQPSTYGENPYEHLRPEESTQELSAGTYVPYRPYEQATFQRWINQSSDARDVYQLTSKGRGQMNDDQQNLNRLSQQSQITGIQEIHEPIHDQTIYSQPSAGSLTQQDMTQDIQEGTSETTQSNNSPIFSIGQEPYEAQSLSSNCATNTETVRQLHSSNFNIPILNDLISSAPSNELLMQSISTKPLQHLNEAELSYVSLALIKEDNILNDSMDFAGFNKS